MWGGAFEGAIALSEVRLEMSGAIAGGYEAVVAIGGTMLEASERVFEASERVLDE